MNKPKRLSLFSVIQWILYAAGLAVYLYLTLSDVNRFQRETYSEIVLENSLILAGILIFYLLTYLIPGWIGSPLRWIGLLSLSGIFLKGYWIIKRSAYFQVFGSLQNVDAAEYYHNAVRLLMGFPAQGTTISRPFFPAFLSSILWPAGFDLHLALVILVALVMCALFLYGEIVRSHFGAIPAALTVAMSFMFYSNYLGAFSSESLGIIFGCIGWVFLFLALENNTKKSFFLGLGFLTLGMFTRAGALFILPTLVLAFLVYYRNRRDQIRYIIGAFVVFVVIYLLNSNILDILSAGSSYLFPNSLYSFYGMAAGGHGWGYFKIARPDIWAMEEPARTQMLFQATVDLIKANPMVLIWNMLKQYYYFVFYGNTSVFSYLFTTIRWYNLALMAGLYLASIWQFVLFIRNRKSLISLVFLAILLGILLSIPFVPPQDESDMRAYAVTVPVMALFPALGIQDWVTRLWRFVQSRFRLPAVKLHMQTASMPLSVVSLLFGVIVFLMAALPTYAIHGIARPDNLTKPVCSANEKPVIWQYLQSNSMRIVPDQHPIGIYSIRMSQVERLMHDIFFAPNLSVFQNMESGYSVSQQVNLVDGASGWFLAPVDQLTTGDGFYTGCAAYHDDDNFYLFDYFKVKKARKMEK